MKRVEEVDILFRGTMDLAAQQTDPGMRIRYILLAEVSDKILRHLATAADEGRSRKEPMGDVVCAIATTVLSVAANLSRSDAGDDSRTKEYIEEIMSSITNTLKHSPAFEIRANF